MNVLEFRQKDYDRIFTTYIPTLVKIKYPDATNIKIEKEEVCTYTSWWYRIKCTFDCVKGTVEQTVMIPILENQLMKLRGTYYIPRYWLVSAPLVRRKKTVVIWSWLKPIIVDIMKDRVYFQVVRETKPSVNIDEDFSTFMNTIGCSDEECPLRSECRLTARNEFKYDFKMINDIFFDDWTLRVYTDWFPNVEKHCAFRYFVETVFTDKCTDLNDMRQKRLSCFENWFKSLILLSDWSRTHLVDFENLLAVPEANPLSIIILSLKCYEVGSSLESIKFNESFEYIICPVSLSDQEPLKYSTLLPEVEVNEIGRFLK